MEQRRFTRIHFDAPAQVTDDERLYAVRLRDLSLNGAMVEPSGSWLPQENSRVSLVIQLAPAVNIEMAARVVYSAGHRVGLECSELDVVSASHLRGFILANLGDPALVNREFESLLALGTRSDTPDD